MSYDKGVAHQAVQFSFAHVLHKLAYKYSRQEDTSDVIDLEEMAIVENRGTIDSMRRKALGKQYVDHTCIVKPAALAGDDEDAECEPDEYTDLEDEEEEEDNDMDTSSGGESAGENASDEEPEEEAGEREDLAKAFPCPGSPTTCTKSFCFACALNT